MTRALNRTGKYLLLIFCAVFLWMPLFVSAEGFISLVGIPGLDGGTPNMQTYINSVMRISIIAAALIAVIKLILAGAKYVLSGIVTEKSQAKKDVRSALIGLLIVLAAVTLLRTINPKLVNLPALENAPVIPFTPREPRDSPTCDLAVARGPDGTCGCGETYIAVAGDDVGYRCVDNSIASPDTYDEFVIETQIRLAIEGGEFKRLVDRFDASILEGKTDDEKELLENMWKIKCESKTDANGVFLDADNNPIGSDLSTMSQEEIDSIVDDPKMNAFTDDRFGGLICVEFN